jgi:hypothetical protein
MDLAFADHSKAQIHTTGGDNYDFGASLATDAQWLIVGEPGGDGNYGGSGNALISYWVDLPWPDGGYYFSEELASLVPSWQLYTGDNFGAAVDISGNFAVVGAPASNIYGNDSGLAFVFEYTGTDGRTGWTWHSTIFNENADYDFGAAVDIDGTHILIGAPGFSGGNGNAFAYEIDSGVNDSVIRYIGPLQQTRQGSNDARFGASIDSDGSLAVIGGPGADLDGDGEFEGIVAVYQRTPNGAYSMEAYLSPAPVQDFDGAAFGEAVAVDGSVLLVGAPAGSTSYSGTVASFERSPGGAWALQDVMGEVILGGLENHLFGSAIAIGGDTAVIGNPYSSPYGLGSGAAVVYHRSPSAGIWTKDHELTGWGTGEGDLLGTAVALGVNSVALGAPDFDWASNQNQGAVYYYWRPDGSDDAWQLDLRGDRPCVASSDTLDGALPVTDYSAFGLSVAVDGNTALIGNPFGGEGFQGEVTLFTRVSESAPWITQPQAAFSPPTGQQFFSLYGSAVALEGTLAIVGEDRHGWWSDGDNGRVHLYLYANDSWTLAQTLTAPEDDRRFGTSVDLTWLNGNAYIAIGAPEHGSADGGRVYMYQWNSGSSTASFLRMLSEDSYTGGPSSFGESVAITVRGASELTVAVGNSASDHAASPNGCVDVFRGHIAWDYWYIYHEARLSGGWDNAEALPSHFAGKGSAVDLDADLLIVGVPGARGSSTVDNFAGAACMYRGGFNGGQTYSWTKEADILVPDASPHNYAGASVAIDSASGTAVVGVPGSNYMDTNAGVACVYRHAGAGWQFTENLISTRSHGSDGLGLSISMDGSNVLVGAPGLLSAIGFYDFGRGELFELDASVTFIDSESGSMGSAASWSIPPQPPATGLFSMYLADPYSVLFDIQSWAGSLRVNLDQIQLVLQGKDRRVTGSIDVGAPADIRTAGLAIKSGTLHVEGDIHVGSDEHAGILRIDADGAVEVKEQLSINAGSSLQLALSDTMSGPRLIAWTKAPELRGGLLVDLGAIQDPALLAEGDRFVLISSGLAPSGGLFDAIILPGLTDGLAFEVQYGPPGRSGSGCPTGEMQDCFGNCFPASWLGDGICDDGIYQHNSVPIYLNCDSLGCDGGDCAKCWNDGGDWEMAIEVVSLAGLLDFGDPNATTVAGDPTGVEIVDLTGDGAEEICVTLAGSPGTLVIFENDGAGGVAQQIIIATGDEPVDVTSGDFDGDGNNDLAVANNLSQDVTIYYNDDNDPADGFVTEDLDVDGPPNCIAGINADFDMYGDLVVGLADADGDGNGYYAIYTGTAALNLGGGGNMAGGGGGDATGSPLGLDPSEEEDQKDYMFSGRQDDGKTAVVGGDGLASNGVILSIVEYTTGADPGGMAVGDLNGDGRGDICVTSTTNGTVAILLQDSANSGAFLPAIYVLIGNTPTRMTSVDFDNDGDLDLAAIVQDVNPITGVDESVVRVLQGNGNLSFTSLETAWGESTVLLDAGDISGDGLSELVTIGGGAALRSRGGTPLLSLRDTDVGTCDGDFDNSGDVNVDDLLILLGEFSSCNKNCIADMDGDNDVDIDDMLLLLGAWGRC